MGIFNFFNSKPQSSENGIGKQEFEQYINVLFSLRKAFASSKSLAGTGQGRSEKMVSVTTSYICILIYYYENVYHYGTANQFFSSDSDFSHYAQVGIALLNPSQRSQVVAGLSSNWADLMVTINLLTMDPSVADTIIGIMPELKNMNNFFCRLK